MKRGATHLILQSFGAIGLARPHCIVKYVTALAKYGAIPNPLRMRGAKI